MCYPKPGPRCAAHTRPILVSALSELNLRRKEYDEERNETTENAFKRAQQDYYGAQIDYFGTPEGQKFALKNAKRAEGAGNLQESFDLIETWKHAVVERAHSMEANAAIEAEFKGLRASTNSGSSLIRGTSLIMGRHAIDKATQKGFDAKTISDTFKNPERVYPNGRYEGQVRVTGNGLCITGEVDGKNFRVKTIYLDDVVTPPTESQMDTPEGREFTERYKKYGSDSRNGTSRREL